MILWLDIEPPTTTAQQKKVTVIGGKPRLYDPTPLKAAKAAISTAIWSERTERGYGTDRVLFPEGALKLKVVWRFSSKSHEDKEYRVTRPDTDNLNKGLKDCMTKCKIWADDAQVVDEQCIKIWSNKPSIWISVSALPKFVDEQVMM